MSSVDRIICRAKSLLASTLAVALLLASTIPTGYAAKQRSVTTPGRVAPKDLRNEKLAKQPVREALDKRPLTFEANVGQTDKSVKFYSRGGGYSFFLTSTEAVLSLSEPGVDDHKRVPFALGENGLGEAGKKCTAVVRMKMLGANPRPHVEGFSLQSGKANYFVGNDPRKWRAGVPTYSRVKYHSIFPGIDLEFYGNPQQMEYDFTVGPGADPRKIRLSFEGADRIEIDAHGDLVLHTPLGEVRQHKPDIYQQVNGVKKVINGSYVLRGRNKVTFSVGLYDITKPLVIDPPIVYSTYLGGTTRTEVRDMAIYTDVVTGNTYAYVIGNTVDQDFPTKNAIQPNYGGSNRDLFVTKLNMAATGPDSVVYSTYLGGNGDEEGSGIAVDSTGAPYLTGYTTATDFPLVNALRTTSVGEEAYITKMRPDGSGLVYSTYLGGSGEERAYSIAVDASGNAYVAGTTSSTNFPVLNAFRTAPAGGFISKIAPPSGGNPASLVYSTYIDGRPVGIATDSSGNAYAAGETSSYNLPSTANAFQPINPFQLKNIPQAWWNRVGFVTKVNTLAAGPASIVYSTYFGGSEGYFNTGDSCNDIAVDSAGNAYVTGNTGSPDFPTTPNSLKPTFDDDADAFVAKLDTTKSGSASLVYSTYLGGHGGRTGFDQGWDIAIDAAGNAYVAGTASSPDFPLVNSVQYYSDGLYVTANEGTSNGALNRGMASYYFKGLVLDRTVVPRTLYVITSHEQLGGPGHDAVLKSVDGGNNWSPLSSLSAPGAINCLALDPKNPPTVYAGTDQGIFRSTDSGSSWSAINNGLSYGATTNVNGFTFDITASSQTLYVGTNDNLYKSPDGGDTWLPTGLNSGAGNLVINTTTTPHTLFAGFQRSTDGGITWTSTDTGFLATASNGF